MNTQNFCNGKGIWMACALAALLTVGAADFSQAADKDGGGYTGEAAPRGGYTGPGPDIVTVKQALDSRDDTRVALKGRITKSLGDKRYIFTDDTGTIQLEIGQKAWRGQQVGADDIIIVQGKVDKDFTSTEVDVKSVIKQ